MVDGTAAEIGLNPVVAGTSEFHGNGSPAASAIGYALEQTASGLAVLVLIDDRCGRAEARRQGLTILGNATVLVLAKERGLVVSCAPLLNALQA